MPGGVRTTRFDLDREKLGGVFDACHEDGEKWRFWDLSENPSLAIVSCHQAVSDANYSRFLALR